MNTTLDIAGRKVEIFFLSVDRIALVPAFADPAVAVTKTTGLLTAFHEGRAADFTATIELDREGSILRFGIIETHASFCRAIALVIDAEFAIDMTKAYDWYRPHFDDAERCMSGAFVGQKVESVPQSGTLDLDRVLPLLVRDEQTFARRRNIVEDVETVRRWIAENGRLPVFSWTGRRDENALAVRTYAYARRLAIAGGVPAPTNPMLASSISEPRRPRLVSSMGAA